MNCVIFPVRFHRVEENLKHQRNRGNVFTHWRPVREQKCHPPHLHTPISCQFGLLLAQLQFPLLQTHHLSSHYQKNPLIYFHPLLLLVEYLGWKRMMTYQILKPDEHEYTVYESALLRIGKYHAPRQTDPVKLFKHYQSRGLSGYSVLNIIIGFQIGPMLVTFQLQALPMFVASDVETMAYIFIPDCKLTSPWSCAGLQLASYFTCSGAPSWKVEVWSNMDLRHGSHALLSPSSVNFLKS